MTVRLRAEPRCSACSKGAAGIELLEKGDPRALSGTTLVLTFLGAHTTLLDEKDIDAVARAIADGDWRALHAIDEEYAAFYCPTCAATYCHREWQEELVWDEDHPQFLDATYGTCPRGHRRMLFD